MSSAGDAICKVICPSSTETPSNSRAARTFLPSSHKVARVAWVFCVLPKVCPPSWGQALPSETRSGLCHITLAPSTAPASGASASCLSLLGRLLPQATSLAFSSSDLTRATLPIGGKQPGYFVPLVLVRKHNGSVS